MKTNKILLCLMFILLHSFAKAQTCTGDLTFETQAQVDQFLIDNPTCTHFDGQLTVYSFVESPDPITNLDGFSNLTFIQNLWIERSPGMVLSMTGLSNVSEIENGYFLGVYDFTGLENLVTAISLDINYLNFYNEPNVVLATFDNLTSLSNLTLEINDATNFLENVFPGLTSLYVLSMNNGSGISDPSDFNVEGLTGFENVLQITNFNIGNPFEMNAHAGDFSILNNTTSIDYFEIGGISCTTFNSFASLEQVDYLSLYVEGHDVYFDNLTSVGQLELWAPGFLPGSYHFDQLTSCYSLYLNGNNGVDVFTLTMNALTDLPMGITIENGTAEDYSNIQFPQLQHVLSITMDGTNATSLEFLSGLIGIDGAVQISYNPLLSSCEISALCELLTVNAGEVYIHNNGPGCSSALEVGSACNLNFVSGLVFADLDCDGAYNNNDVQIQNPVMIDDLGTPMGQSTSTGQYFIPLPYNTSTTFSPVTSPAFLPVSQATITTDGTTQSFLDQNFSLCADPAYHDVSVTAYAWLPIPGFDRGFFFHVKNNGANVEDAILTFDFSNMPGASFVSANFPTTIVGNTVSVALSGITFLEEIIVSINMHVSASTPLGTIYHPMAHLALQNNIDSNPLNNDFTWTQTVVGSFDPNDITVNIEAQNVDEIPSEGLSLVYLVRFQNTGTAAAEFVRVRSTMDEDLQLGSIEVLNASHPFLLSFNENREVEWLFENIQLPDSASDEEGSHGFIQYRIKTQPDITIDHVVENTAAIYFDYNAPVITNTATTVFYECPTELVIEGDNLICEGQSVVVQAATGWENYSWTLNNGVLGTSESITVENATAGIYSVECIATVPFCESTAGMELTVVGMPVTPIITQSGNTLTSSGSGLFYWTLNGVAINDSDNSIEITESGTYGVSVTSNGCTSSETSSDYSYTGILENRLEAGISLMPNPMTHSTQLKVSGAITNAEVRITNSIGQVVLQKKMTSYTMMIDKEDLSEGVYAVSLLVGDHVVGKSIKLLVIQ